MKKNNLIFVGRQGFTLIEILLAVMIVAFSAGSLYAAFAAGIKCERRVSQNFKVLGDSRMIMEAFYKDIGRSVFYDFRGSFPDQKSFFADETKIIFLIDDQGEFKWVRYGLLAPDKGQVKQTRVGAVFARNVVVSNVSQTQAGLSALARDENDFVHFFESDGQPQKREILTGRVADQGWQIFFSSSTESPAQMEWKSGWDEDFLPAAVRVSVSVPSGNGQVVKSTRDFVLPAGGRHEP